MELKKEIEIRKELLNQMVPPVVRSEIVQLNERYSEIYHLVKENVNHFTNGMIILREERPDAFVARGMGCSGGGRTAQEALDNLHAALVNDKIMNPEKYKEKVMFSYDRSKDRFAKTSDRRYFTFS